MLTPTDTQEAFHHWKARLFDVDEATCLEAVTRLVDVANKSKPLRRECTDLIALRLETLLKDGGDLFSTLEAASDLSRGIISSSEYFMLALMKIPRKDSYALNMATSMLLYEMEQGFINPGHAMEKPVLDMAAQVATACKGEARRHALRMLELAQANPN